MTKVNYTKGGFLTTTFVGDDEDNNECELAYAINALAEDPNDEVKFFDLINQLLPRMKKDFINIEGLIRPNLSNSSVTESDMCCVVDIFELGLRDFKGLPTEDLVVRLQASLSIRNSVPAVHSRSIIDELAGPVLEKATAHFENMLSANGITEVTHELEEFFIMPLIVHRELLLPAAKLLYYR